MQVENLIGEAPQEVHREESHPAGEHDKVRLKLGHSSGKTEVVVLAQFAIEAFEKLGSDATLLRSAQRVRIFDIREYTDHLCIELASSTCVDDCLQV